MSYQRSAYLYDLIYAARKDYARESHRIRDIVRSEIGLTSGTLLDIGCGTALHAGHLAESFEIEGIDFSSEMLRIARRRVPSGKFHLEDMRTFDLGRKFDVIISLFGAVGHLESLDELRMSARRIRSHTHRGGLIIIEPWYLPGRWRPRRLETNFFPDQKVLRVVESVADDNVATLKMHYFLDWPSNVQYFRVDHKLTSWSEEEFKGVFTSCGIELRFIEDGLTARGLFIGRIDEV